MGMRAVLVVSRKAGDGAGEQWRKLLDYALARGFEIAGAAFTLHGAADMVTRGEADVVLVETRQDLPFRLESVTSGFRQQDRPGRRQRPHRLR